MRRSGIFMLGVLMVCGLLLCGCMNRGSLGTGANEYKVMFLQKSRMELSGISYYTDETDPTLLVSELWSIFTVTPEDTGVVTISNDRISLLDWKIEENILSMYFSAGYELMDAATELLFRAGVVETFGQIPGVEGILFYVAGAPLCDSTGQVLAAMTPEDFVDITGTEVNSVQISNIALYFTNKAGDTLFPYTMKVAYGSNTSIEEFVLEQLIEGPSEEGLYPTLNPDIQVNSVEVRNRVCYVDFDQAFLNNDQPVQDNIVIYSIVNSLCELPGIYQVQFSVNGVTNLKFRDTISLSETFERNLDYADSGEKLQIVEEGLGIYY